jgi:hypothetical protein
MLRFNNSSISKIISFILVATLLPLVGYYLLFSKTKDSSKEKTGIFMALPDHMARVSELWINGDFDHLESFKSSKCKNLVNNVRETDFLSCNPIYFECLMQKHKIDNFQIFKSKSNHFIPQINQFGRFTEFTSKGIVLSFLESNHKKLFTLRLQNTCNQKLLPKNIYSAGVGSSDDFIWDNFDYDILIDRNYTTELDVLLWVFSLDNTDSVKEKKLKKKLESYKLHSKVALGLTVKEQTSYCSWRGKYLLTSRALDAATYFPSKNQAVYKHFFPWTKKRKSFLTGGEKLSKSNCKNTYIKGCNKFLPFSNTESFAISWMGINHSLGSYMESVNNDFLPKANLKVSHMGLKSSSYWHKLGLRGFWDGSGFRKRNFSFIEQYSNRPYSHDSEILGVAFRCMELR